MGTVQNVRLQFQLGGSETVAAANQHVYLDMTQGSMTHLQTNAQGVIVATGGQGATLDDSRDYRIVTSASAITPVPQSRTGTTVRVRNRTITVTPHIRIQITGTRVGGIPCELSVGTATSNVTTTTGGSVWSNNRSAGAVTLAHRPPQRIDTKLLKTSGAANPQASLAVNPATLNRGSQGTITITPPANSVGFRMAEWAYEISHENPGLGTSTATVTRPENENPGTWDQNWAGVMCASGTVTAKFALGVNVRASGAAAVSVSVVAAGPVSVSATVTIAARSGTTWESTLTTNGEQSYSPAINAYSDLGEHRWNAGAANIRPSTAINSGPNKECQYVSSASAAFTSTPRINGALSSGGAFAQAQGKAYLLEPTPVRAIPNHLYTVVGPEGAISITNQTAFQTWAGQASRYRWSSECISAAALLAGTRRHEHTHSTGRNHKENCLKARRALDPVTFAEKLVRVPGEQLDFGQEFQSRRQLVMDAGPTHDIIDEAQTRTSHALEYVSGQTIPDVNADANGARIAPVWNPSTNNYL